MPNWCENDLIIRAKSPEQMQEVMDFIGSEERNIDFDKIIPYPWKALDKFYWDFISNWGHSPLGIESDAYNFGGYHWCIDNWGTKWNASNSNLQPMEQANAVMITFDTAWAPPIPVIRKLQELFPKVAFSMESYECGMAFQTKLKANGECFEGDYSGHRGG